MNYLTMLNFVCEKYGVSIEELKSDKFTRNLSTPRNICMRLMREKFCMNNEQIGSVFNRSDASASAQIKMAKFNKNMSSEYDYMLHSYELTHEEGLSIEEKISLKPQEIRNKIFELLNN